MHEQSETIKGRDGRWYNVYGEGTGAPQPIPLPQLFGFEQSSYPTAEEASNKAAWRSQLGEGHYAMQPPQYGFTNSYEPSPQAKAFGKVIDILNDPRNAWIGMGPLAGVVKGPGWGAEALRRYKLIGGTPETLNTTLKRRAFDPNARRNIVKNFKDATDIATPSGGQDRRYLTRFPFESTVDNLGYQANSMDAAGNIYDIMRKENYNRGAGRPPLSTRDYTLQNHRTTNPVGPRDVLPFDLEEYFRRQSEYGDAIESAAAGNAAYGAVSRQVARMLDTPGFYFKRAEDLPPLSDEEYTKVFPLPPSVDVDSVAARIRDAFRHDELNLNQRTERQRDSRGRLPTGRTE